jgi:ketosteroid isomerase-like protein
VSLSRPNASPGSHALGADPGRTASDFAVALLGGDAGAAAAYFAPDARFLTPDGTEVAGRPAITEVLSQLTASNQKLEIRTGRTLRVEGVALATQYWKRVSSAARVEPFERSTTTSLVLGREGVSWSILIASPWG